MLTINGVGFQCYFWIFLAICQHILIDIKRNANCYQVIFWGSLH